MVGEIIPESRATSPGIRKRCQAIRRKLSWEDRLEIGVNPICAHVVEVANISPGQRGELEIAVAALG